MIQLNITFYVHISVRDGFLEWVRTTFIPEATAGGVVRDARLMLVEHQVEPDALTYAVQFVADEAAAARLWHDEGRGAAMLRSIVERHTQKVLFFSSFMDILPL